MGSLVTLLEAQNQHRIDQANTDAKRMVQQGSNTRTAADASLQRFNQSLRNQDLWNQAGDQFNTQVMNLNRQLDAVTSGGLVQSLQASHKLGQLAAESAASGTTGSSVDTLNATLRLQDTLNSESTNRAVDQSQFDSATRRTSILTAAAQGTSFDNYQANLDYTTYLDPQEQKNRLGTVVLAAVATYFGGPQAGDAVIQVANAGNQMINQNTQNSFNAFNAAARGAVQGFQTYSQTAASGGWAQTVFGGGDGGGGGSAVSFDFAAASNGADGSTGGLGSGFNWSSFGGTGGSNGF